MFFKEMLPNVQRKKQDHVNSQQPITSTVNCNVIVVKKGENRSSRSITLNSNQTVDDNRKSAVLIVEK